MTVYNVSNLINNKLKNSIKKYYKIKKFDFVFSDWSYIFGIRSKELTQKQKNILLKFLLLKTNANNMSVFDLQKFPLINSRQKKGFKNANL